MTDPQYNPADPAEREDDRSDIEQAVDARKDALERGEGGPEPDMLSDDGEFSGNAGTGGVVKNQDMDQQ